MTQGFVFFRQWIASLLLLVLAASAHSLTLSDDQDSYQASLGMQWLADAQHAYSPKMALQAFLDGEGEEIHDKYPHWAFVKAAMVPRADRQPKQPGIVVCAPWPPAPGLSRPLPVRPARHSAVAQPPWRSRSLRHPHLCPQSPGLHAHLPVNAQRYLLLRAQGDNVIELPISLMSPIAFNQQDTQVSIFHGLYFGAMVAIFCSTC